MGRRRVGNSDHGLDSIDHTINSRNLDEAQDTIKGPHAIGR